MTELEQLKIKFALDPNTRLDILNAIIKTETEGVKKSKIPKLVLVGAQPGSGKSEVQVMNQFSNPNLIICNSDNFRGYHLYAAAINRDHEKYYPELTVEYAQAWNRDLIEYCRENKYDVLLETTFRDPDLINATLKSFKDSGYDIEVNLLAVSSKVSLLGTYVRLEEMRAKFGVGRAVSKNDHDSRYSAIPNTLTEVVNAKMYNKLNIYGRSIYNNNSNVIEGVYMVAGNPQDPLSVYLAERDKPLSEKGYMYISDKINRVAEMMKLRGANDIEISIFKDIINNEAHDLKARRRY